MNTMRIIPFLLLTATATWADSGPYKLQHTLVCDRTEVMIAALTRAGERVEWVAQSDLDDGLTLSMWHSSVDNTVTIIVSGVQDSCIVHTATRRINMDKIQKQKPNM